jgi:hypothetical protein
MIKQAKVSTVGNFMMSSNARVNAPREATGFRGESFVALNEMSGGYYLALQ